MGGVGGQKGHEHMHKAKRNYEKYISEVICAKYR
jgi:hypothetical protein